MPRAEVLIALLVALLGVGYRSTSASSVLRVPEDVSSLQDAIYQVQHLGVIDIAPGEYPVPSSGLQISNLGKSFTIRSRDGISSSVVLKGEGNRPVLIFDNTAPSLGGTVIFEGITFHGGFSNQDGRAGGVTLQRASAVFRNCRFVDNQGMQPNSGGGGTVVGQGSTALFEGCLWKNNSARLYGGGLAVGAGSEVSVLRSTFEGNTVSIPNHSPTAAGGGVHVSNSTVFIFGSVFKGNTAGYVGGGLYAIGSWAPGYRTRVTIWNTIFEANRAERHPSVSFPFPTESGAVHAEDNTLVHIHRSYFFFNSAMTLGGIGLYRAAVTVTHSYLRGNRATGVGPATGFGGAIGAISNDTSIDGSINYPAARLAVRHTLIEGVDLNRSQAASGIYVAGDTNRQYGLSGVPAQADLAQNRAKLVLENVALYNTDVEETPGAPGTGVGGGLVGDLADIEARDVLVVGADAIGATNSSGGAIALLNNSLLAGHRITLAYNTSHKFGGALFVQGSELHLFDCHIFGNEVSPGIAEGLYESYGSAIFTTPDSGRGLHVGGQLNGCTVSSNIGLPFFDDDRTSPPYNFFQYNGNRVFNTTFGGIVYRNSAYGFPYSPTGVPGLNNLVIDRTGVGPTRKSAIANVALTQKPALAAALSIPPLVHSSDPLHYLVYAWSGDNATLNANPLTSSHGLQTYSAAPATYVLSVNSGQQVVTARVLVMSAFLPYVGR